MPQIWKSQEYLSEIRLDQQASAPPQHTLFVLQGMDARCQRGCCVQTPHLLVYFLRGGASV